MKAFFALPFGLAALVLDCFFFIAPPFMGLGSLVAVHDALFPQ
jgi:hypothetical protein